MELLDIRNPDGSKTGTVKSREMVHANGDLHGTSHVWIVRKKEEGRWDVLLQKRAVGKDAFPGFYDISSAGHIPAGQDYEESALRELEEELGIHASIEDLAFIGYHKGYFEEMFYGKMFKNYEISKVYLYKREVDISKLILQKEEVESVKWMDLDECIKKIRRQDYGYCLPIKELYMLKDYLQL